MRLALWELHVDECVFAYSDVSYESVMGVGAIVNAAGANFKLLGPNSTAVSISSATIAKKSSTCSTEAPLFEKAVTQETIHPGQREGCPGTSNRASDVSYNRNQSPKKSVTREYQSWGFPYRDKKLP